MKFNLVPIIFSAVTVGVSADDSVPDFAALKAETESMKTELLRESKSIDTKLRSIVEHTPSEKESFVQLESMEQLQRNRHKFEEESTTLLQANKAKVEKYKERFDELLAKLREDVSDNNYGSSSFLELSESPLDVDKLFAEAKAKVDKLHFVARDIREAARHWNKGADAPPVKEESFDAIDV